MPIQGPPPPVGMTTSGIPIVKIGSLRGKVKLERNMAEARRVLGGTVKTRRRIVSEFIRLIGVGQGASKLFVRINPNKPADVDDLMREIARFLARQRTRAQFRGMNRSINTGRNLLEAMAVAQRMLENKLNPLPVAEQERPQPEEDDTEKKRRARKALEECNFGPQDRNRCRLHGRLRTKRRTRKRGRNG